MRMAPLLERMFQRIDLGRVPGSDMSAHMPTLYALARLCSFGGVVECGVGAGFSTHPLLCGAIEGGAQLHSYDINAACWSRASQNMGLVEGDSALGKWTFKEKDCAEAATDWADGSVGLLFLDTSHHLEATRRELAAWLPKMHPNGIMCGHDYYLHLSPGWENISRVKQAVDEFAISHQGRFRLQVTPYDQGLFILWPK